MKKSRFTEQQIAFVLQQAEAWHSVDIGVPIDAETAMVNVFRCSSKKVSFIFIFIYLFYFNIIINIFVLNFIYYYF